MNKRAEREDVARHAGCTFVPFVSTEQGHLGPAAINLIDTLAKLPDPDSDEADPPPCMDNGTRMWWLARMARSVIMGTHNLALAYRSRSDAQVTLSPDGLSE